MKDVFFYFFAQFFRCGNPVDKPDQRKTASMTWMILTIWLVELSPSFGGTRAFPFLGGGMNGTYSFVNICLLPPILAAE